jgi:nucleolar MIF4G domain-containing protein 1
VFNPFYAHLAAKLCSFDYNYKFTLQYTFWDRFKQLPTLPVRTISNLGLLLAHLIAGFALSLSVLKVHT